MLCRDARARARRGWRASIDATTTTRSVMDDARASSTRSGDDAIASPRVERALKALRFELASGCVDVRGKTSTFSEFARNELVTMGEEIGAVDDARRAKWDEECASAFAKYEGLNARQRERALHAARDLLNGTTETPTKTPTETPTTKPAGKQSIIEGDAWKHALEQGHIRQREVEAVMRNKANGDDDASQEQGTNAWFQLRASRLTASAFGNAIGFWREGRNELWEEKLGLREGFAGNEATEWGSSKEDEAVRVYEAFAGRKVSHLLFNVLSADDAELWIGASPDGLIGTNAADVDGEIGGVLEIKCPFNKGSPTTASPYAKVPWYYVPQVQGLMAVFDRPWCDLVSYTVNGGVAIYRVERDHDYWNLLYECCSEFWWQHVVPGKHALAAGKDAEKYRPASEHPLCAELKRRSKAIADKSPTTWIAPDRVADLRRR